MGLQSQTQLSTWLSNWTTSTEWLLLGLPLKSLVLCDVLRMQAENLRGQEKAGCEIFSAGHLSSLEIDLNSNPIPNILFLLLMDQKKKKKLFWTPSISKYYNTVNIKAKSSQRPKSFYVLFFTKLIGRIPAHPLHFLSTPAPTYTQHITKNTVVLLVEGRS